MREYSRDAAQIEFKKGCMSSVSLKFMLSRLLNNLM